MGDSSISCCLTGHTIKSGEVVMIPIAPARYIEDGDRKLPSFPGGGKIFSNNGACALFMPLTLPIFGRANYSHSIGSIERDANTKWLEKRLKISIEDFVYAASNGGNIPQMDKIAKYVHDYEFAGKSRHRLEWDGVLRYCYVAREAWDIFSKERFCDSGEVDSCSEDSKFWKMAEDMMKDMESYSDMYKDKDKVRFERIKVEGNEELMKDIEDDARARVKSRLLKDLNYTPIAFDKNNPYKETYCGYGYHVSVSANEIGGYATSVDAIDKVDHKSRCIIDDSFVPKIKFTGDTWKLLDGVGLTKKKINKPELRSTMNVPYIRMLCEEMVVSYRKVLMDKWCMDRLFGLLNFIGNMSSVNRIFQPNTATYTYGNYYAEKRVAEISLKLANGRIRNTKSD